MIPEDPPSLVSLALLFNADVYRATQPATACALDGRLTEIRRLGIGTVPFAQQVVDGLGPEYVVGLRVHLASLMELVEEAGSLKLIDASAAQQLVLHAAGLSRALTQSQQPSLG